MPKNPPADLLPPDSEQSPPAASRQVRLLLDSPLGRVNDVVELQAHEADALVAGLQADDTPEAVAYALTLPQNQPPAADPT